MSLLTLAGCISISDISLSVGYGLFYGGRLAMPQTCKPIRPTLSAFSNCLFGFLGRKTNVQMKKYLFALLVCVMAFAGCSKDDETPKFNYDLETLYGTWRVTEIQQKDGSFLDVTTSVAEMVFEPTYATFNENGTYSGRGEFGTGSGTYKAEGNTIYTYVEGVEYLRYEVKSLSGEKCHLVMKEQGSSSTLKSNVLSNKFYVL
jgi:hypothetical protein